MKRINRKLKKAWQKGVVTIEFALGFFAFWLLIAAWVEMSYISYVSAIGDLAVSKASRMAKKDTENYVAVFNQVLNDSNEFWSNYVSSDNFTASVRFVKDLNELDTVTDVCMPESGLQTATCGTETNSAIAIYYVSYNFDNLFTYFIADSSVFAREIIVVQEYERDKFEI